MNTNEVVKIVANNTNHDYKIGDHVTILEIGNIFGIPTYLVKDSRGMHQVLMKEDIKRINLN